MGDLRPNDGPPDEGADRDRLPGVPGEWGAVIVPDDASELAAEARAVRRELRRRARRGSPDRPGTPAPRGRDRLPPDSVPPGLGVPFLIIGVAVLVTVMSLFVITWNPGSGRPVPTATTPAPVDRPGAPASPPTASGTALRATPAIPPDGRPWLSTIAPAILLTAGR